MTADRHLGIHLTELKREAASESKVAVLYLKVVSPTVLCKSVNSKGIDVLGYHLYLIIVVRLR